MGFAPASFGLRQRRLELRVRQQVSHGSTHPGLPPGHYGSVATPVELGLCKLNRATSDPTRNVILYQSRVRRSTKIGGSERKTHELGRVEGGPCTLNSAVSPLSSGAAGYSSCNFSNHLQQFWIHLRLQQIQPPNLFNAEASTTRLPWKGPAAPCPLAGRCPVCGGSA